MAKEKDHNFLNVSDKQLDYLERKLAALLPTEDKEGRKSFAGLFDGLTLKTIFGLFHSEYLQDFEFPIATGKEADVFCATNNEGELRAIKIFRTNTTAFKNMLPYLEGDRRFMHLRKGTLNISRIWTHKEFKNLHRLHDAGVPVPEPIHFKDNIIIMEYIGDETMAAPNLRTAAPHVSDFNKVYAELKDALYKGYRKAKLVHADLSEYNLLYWKDKLWVIDVGQAVLSNHPHANKFLRRDIKNIVRYFSKQGVDTGTEEEIWDWLHEGLDED